MLLTALSLSLRLGEKDLHTYLDDTLALVAEKEPNIQALLPEQNRRERLHQTADELYAKYPEPDSRPPLFGVLFGVKDLFNVDGLPTQAGSKLPPEAFSGDEAEVVTQLKRLGAIVLGKTVSTEFAYFSPGPTRNPVNLSHTPGGSSSGSAAAVAAGYCPFALGTQTIASIIRPASYCGVYGFKPSYGLFSTKGVFPFSQTADHVGFIADSLSTLSVLLGSLECLPIATRIPPEPRIGCVRGEYLGQTGEQGRASYQDTIRKLTNRGFSIMECDPFPDIEMINLSHRRMIAAEFYHNHRHLHARYGHLYSQHSLDLYRIGQEVSQNELNELRKQTLELRIKLSNILELNALTAFLTPSTTGPAPLGLQSTGSPLLSLPWTNAGLPSISIPCGFTADALPMGVQVVGAFRDDLVLLDLAAKLEEALDQPDSYSSIHTEG